MLLITDTSTAGYTTHQQHLEQHQASYLTPVERTAVFGHHEVGMCGPGRLRYDARMLDGSMSRITVKAATIGGVALIVGVWLYVGYSVTRQLNTAQRQVGDLSLRYGNAPSRPTFHRQRTPKGRQRAAWQRRLEDLLRGEREEVGGQRLVGGRPRRLQQS